MKYCEKCGAEIRDDVKFCPVCGFPQVSQETVKTEEEAYSETMKAQEEKVERDFNESALHAEAQYSGQPYFGTETVSQIEVPADTEISPEDAAVRKSILTFGILGIAFGVSWMFSFLGIVFGSIALSKSKKYMAKKNITALSGKAKIGHILAKAGLITGIIFSVLFLIVFAVSCTASLVGNIFD